MTIAAALLPLVFYCATFVQDDTRGIIPAQFVKTRPAKGQGGTAKPNIYRPVTPKSKMPRDAKVAQVGLTIWRLRPAAATDGGARIIVHHDGATDELIPERIAAQTPLRIGEKVRFSFEAPQTGHLYVIDREQFADGTLGEPFLIFPTTRTREGNNRVAPGTIIEIPSQEDRPNYFTMRKSRADQVGEQLIVIVSNAPLPDITIGPKPLALTVEQIKAWEQQWVTHSEVFELAGGAGKTWTQAEQEAGSNATRQLTQEDPSPQTIYRVATKPGAPLLVKVGLRYGQPRPARR